MKHLADDFFSCESDVSIVAAEVCICKPADVPRPPD